VAVGRDVDASGAGTDVVEGLGDFVFSRVDDDVEVAELCRYGSRNAVRIGRTAFQMK
jgi:hypothetical protein